tara:strand:+ start:2757 stop:3104 length:348 start_codon:yes stop_codon:yes gene_type:complete
MAKSKKTPFTKENLIVDGAYVYYSPSGRAYAPDQKFVARFKHMRRNRGPFMTFLRRNFTVEEYFSRLDAGESPVAILESKGYVPSHIKKWLREAGYPQTPEGFDAWIAAQSAARS